MLATASTVRPRVHVGYVPILDVERGRAAGYQAVARGVGGPDADVRGDLDAGSPWEAAGLPPFDRGGEHSAALISASLGVMPTLPVDTFVSTPVSVRAAATSAVHAALRERADLRGVVLELVGPISSVPIGDLEDSVAAYRAMGALVAVGGHGAPQPELAGVVRLKPSIIRLGRDWVRGVDRSAAKRQSIDVIGRLAGQLDARVLAEGVESAAELRVLAELGVPLAQGPFVGEPREIWPEVATAAQLALPQPVNLVTSVTDVVDRATNCPRPTRFAPVGYPDDDAGRLVGTLRMERLLRHLAEGRQRPGAGCD